MKRSESGLDTYVEILSAGTTVPLDGFSLSLHTCKLCGAVVMFNPRSEASETGRELHERWHAKPTKGKR